MANPYKNKVIVDGTTLIDLTADTVTASALMQGYTAHDASGAQITGTATGGSMVIRDEADSHGGTIRHITAGTVVTGTTSITENGSYDVAQYADAVVNVPAPAPSLQSKTATPTESQQTIAPDSGYDGLSSVSVGAIDSSYIGSAVTRRASSDLTASGATVTAPAGYYEQSASKSVASGSAATPSTSITANPSISVDANGLITASVSGSKSVTPTVSAGYVSSGTAGTVSVSGSNTSQLSTQTAATITPSTTAQTAVAAGKYTTGAVTVAAMPSGTAGTPTASKTVSGHTATITPSVTNSTGYITGGTVTGTAVSVAASELVSGTLSITSSGTKDVTNYASASVAAGSATASATKGTVSNHSVTVTPTATRTAGYVTAGSSNGTAVTVSASELVSGTLSITENGTYDVAEYADVEVSVAGASSTRSATISRSDGQSYPRVQVNGTGAAYSANEAQFTWEDGDTLRFNYGGTDYYAYTYVNGVQIHFSSAGGYYTYTPPKCDIDIQFVRNTSQEIEYVYINYPYLEITSAGTYDVSDYCGVVVNISA